MNKETTNEAFVHMELRLDTNQLGFVTSINGISSPEIIGSLSKVRNWLSQGHLSSAAVENIINEVEDLIMPMIAQLPADLELKVSGGEWPIIFNLLSTANGTHFSIEAVENLYRQLANYAMGSPLAWKHAVSPEQVVLSLVILREVMHHAEFSNVSLLKTAGDFTKRKLL